MPADLGCQLRHFALDPAVHGAEGYTSPVTSVRDSLTTVQASRSVVLAIVVAIAFPAASCRDKSAPLPRTDRPLDVLAEARLLDGSRLDPASFDGKVVVINFWSPG